MKVTVNTSAAVQNEPVGFFLFPVFFWLVGLVCFFATSLSIHSYVTAALFRELQAEQQQDD